ncbi:MAG: efflux transporter periplasmic adaptor subunit [Desulfobulbaceae bacterium A2]|nr:MAG: efflux transporter periplasmic adaptor subunit [Desulfobulbaceae bacterium A2]
MKKRVFLVMVIVLLLIGVVAGIKFLQIRRMIDTGKKFVMPPEVVTAAGVQSEQWETLLAAVGSLEAVQGVTMTAETPGKVARIAFTPGSVVQTGDLLLQQDISIENAQLHVAETKLNLARINFNRAAQLLPGKGVSRSDYDTAEAQLRQTEAELENIRAIIARKSIRAPFAGRLGISLVDPGQNLKEGDSIVSLQALDPILVNFSLPQQHLSRISTGLTVRVLSDALSGQSFEGVISTINPEVDAATRNVRVQARLANPAETLRPGMYATVQVVLPGREPMLAIPATAVLHAPYSDSVFVVEEKTAEGGKAELAVRQQFVKLGERRGDFVAVVSGLKGGENVVSTGVFKLRNGQNVVVDNTLSPKFEHKPTVGDS